MNGSDKISRRISSAPPRPGSGPPTLVVGVDGSPDSLRALRYAGAEAASTGAVLRLVHVVPDFVPVSPMLPNVPIDLVPLGSSVLEKASGRVTRWFPGIEVETRLLRGDAAGRLAANAADAAAVVVGRDERPLLERLLRGDTATALAARSTAPVVVVPARWDGDTGRIVVGVKSSRHAPELLAEAFRVARQRHASLLVVHAWKLPGAYDDIIEARVDLDTLRAEAVREMKGLLQELRGAFPDVPVEVEVVHDHAAHALVEASRVADLVVVGRRGHGVPAAVHLGSTTRAVLRAAPCPVRVVAPDDTARGPGRPVRRERQLA
jgi:nucleotide-binding universal stress UspA family protein